MASKNYWPLGHTKLLFTEQKIMNPENLHMYHTFSSSISITINISKALQKCYWQQAKPTLRITQICFNIAGITSS